MDIKFRNLNNGAWTRSEGMSQIRFNREGKVLIHRDFWDAAGGQSVCPYAGCWISVEMD